MAQCKRDGYADNFVSTKCVLFVLITVALLRLLLGVVSMKYDMKREKKRPLSNMQTGKVQVSVRIRAVWS